MEGQLVASAASDGPAAADEGRAFVLSAETFWYEVRIICLDGLYCEIVGLSFSTGGLFVAIPADAVPTEAWFITAASLTTWEDRETFVGDYVDVAISTLPLETFYELRIGEPGYPEEGVIPFSADGRLPFSLALNAGLAEAQQFWAQNIPVPHREDDFQSAEPGGEADGGDEAETEADLLAARVATAQRGPPGLGPPRSAAAASEFGTPVPRGGEGRGKGS
jgi:hypothetical protein